MDDVDLGVRILVAQVSPLLDTADQVGGNDRLDDLGFDGQDITDLIMFLEGGFCVSLPDHAFGALTTVDDVVNAVHAARAELVRGYSQLAEEMWNGARYSN